MNDSIASLMSSNNILHLYSFLDRTLTYFLKRNNFHNKEIALLSVWKFSLGLWKFMQTFKEKKYNFFHFICKNLKARNFFRYNKQILNFKRFFISYKTRWKNYLCSDEHLIWKRNCHFNYFFKTLCLLKMREL